jgi:hypothetical protein
MFRKLNITHSFSCERKPQPFTSFGEDINGKFRGIAYYNTTPQKQKEVLNILPEKYRKYFDVSVMEINHSIPPHIDSKTKTVINAYIETANATSIFYNLKSDNVERKRLENQEGDGCYFDENDLVPCGEFIAKPGEMWILDVSKPHSVRCVNDDVRISYSIQSDMPFSFFDGL